jgi:hypothetical protein
MALARAWMNRACSEVGAVALIYCCHNYFVALDSWVFEINRLRFIRCNGLFLVSSR